MRAALLALLAACGSSGPAEPPSGDPVGSASRATSEPLTSFAPGTVVSKLDFAAMRKYCEETRVARAKLVGKQDDAELNCLREAVLQPVDRTLDDAGYRSRCAAKLAECLARTTPPEEAPPCSDKKIESWQRCGTLTIGQFDACWRARFERQASLVPLDICNQLAAANPKAVLLEVQKHMQPPACGVVQAKCR